MKNMNLLFTKDRAMDLYVFLLAGLLCANVGFTVNSPYMDFKQVDDIVFKFVSTSGSDNLGCGQKQHPCKSLKFALDNVANATSVIINIFQGVYSFESVKLDCSVGRLRNVFIQGLW